MAEKKAELDANDILIAEFEYARETASQAMEDRHKMVNYFLIIVGVFLNAIVAFLKGEFDKNTVLGSNFSETVLSGLLFIVFLIGFLYLLKLIRLRVAWFESAKCMNTIKDFYDEHLSELKLKDKAFRWTTESLKEFKLQKFDTIFCYSALLIIFIDSLAIAALLVNSLKAYYWIAALAFFVVLTLQYLYYCVRLSKVNK